MITPTSTRPPTAASDSTENRLTRVLTCKLVQSENYQVRRNYLGVIESARESQIGFEFDGKLINVFVDEGLFVKKNQLLAQLDTQILESEIRSLTAKVTAAKFKLEELERGPRREVIRAAEANLSYFQAQQKLARTNLSRQKRLIQTTATSTQEFDEATSSELALDAQVAMAKAKLEELNNGTRAEQIEAQRGTLAQLIADKRSLEIRLRKSSLHAPYDAVVTRRFIDEGTIVRAAQALFEIHDPNQTRLRFGLPVQVAKKLSASGSSFDFSAQHQHGTIATRFETLRRKKDSSTQTVDVLLSPVGLNDNSPELLLGETVELSTTQTITESGFWIPASALVENYRGLWGCYVVKKAKRQDVLRLAELEVLHRTENRAYVRGAIRTGDRIVISGTHRIVVNQPVFAIDQADSKTSELNPIQ